MSEGQRNIVSPECKTRAMLEFGIGHTEYIEILSWGLSLVGRAPALHAGGQEFDSPSLHHYIARKS